MSTNEHILLSSIARDIYFLQDKSDFDGVANDKELLEDDVIMDIAPVTTFPARLPCFQGLRTTLHRALLLGLALQGQALLSLGCPQLR